MSSIFHDPLILLAVGTLSVAVAWKISSSRSSGLPLPPGPKKLPLIGNLLDMPKNDEWVTYARWGKQYGSDLIHIQVAGSSIVVVNSAEVAHDLFDKRSTIYSSRPRFVMLNELMGWEWAVAHMPDGEMWRQHRRLFQKELHPSTTPTFQPAVTKFAHRLLVSMHQTPEDFMSHMRHFVGGVLMNTSHGVDVLPMHDPYIDIIERALAGLIQAIVPGRFIVETFPILKYLPKWAPGGGFHQKAQGWKKSALKAVMFPFAKVKRDLAEGVPNDSFSSRCIAHMDETKDIAAQEKVIRQTAAVIFVGGTDTTVSGLNSFILSMVCHPEVQAKAHQELETVLKGERLPTYEDAEKLPYVTAVVREVLRWQPVTPLAIPHAVTTDDEYNGYHIPKDSIVIGNAWAMLHDERDYPDPFSFKPERWLTPEGKINPNIREPTAIFGYGRRACVGKQLALSIMWMAVASILAAYRIEKAKDKDGNPIEPSMEYYSAIVRAPSPFPCVIAPRSEAADKLIREIIQ